jgi:hypothetical protein
VKFCPPNHLDSSEVLIDRHGQSCGRSQSYFDTSHFCWPRIYRLVLISRIISKSNSSSWYCSLFVLRSQQYGEWRPSRKILPTGTCRSRCWYSPSREYSHWLSKPTRNGDGAYYSYLINYYLIRHIPLGFDNELDTLWTLQFPILIIISISIGVPSRQQL